ncbi:MAG: hypothetical protein ASARMPREDX12_009124 [Alectoria sarmentosa]|nr:MAG: hypothetical protein ASARMPREDX12_009124 [Alectoria sarmentosa]
MAIADRSRQCVRSFGRLAEFAQQNVGGYESQVSITTVSDEFGRFKIWAGNIGALQEDSRSLDYRLREASQVRDQVTKILQDLEFSLHECIAIVSGQRPQRERSSSEEEDLGDEFSDTSDSESSDTSKQEAASELTHLFLAITEAITSLYKLSISIRNPAPRDRYAKAASLNSFDVSYDVGHVYEKYPHVRSTPWLMDRVGRAITRRREFLRYREKHREKLATDIRPIDMSDRNRQAETREMAPFNALQTPTEGPVLEIEARSINYSQLASTKATTYVANLNDENLEKGSIAGRSETTYVTSIAEEESYSVREIPDPPKESANGMPFECPYCFTVLSVKNTKYWNGQQASALLGLCEKPPENIPVSACPFCAWDSNYSTDPPDFFDITSISSSKDSWDPYKVLNVYPNAPNFTVQFDTSQRATTVKCLESMSDMHPSRITLAALSSLAQNTLCRDFHQWQAEAKITEWKAKIKEYLHEHSERLPVVSAVNFEGKKSVEGSDLPADDPHLHRQSGDRNVHHGPVVKALSVSSPTVMVSSLQFQRHVAHHLEQLALFALPPPMRDSSGASSDQAAASHNSDHTTGADAISEISSQPSTSTDYGSTPELYGAVMGGEIRVVRREIRNGADLTLQWGRFGNVLQAAAASLSWPLRDEILRALLNNGADANMQGGLYGNALQAVVSNPGIPGRRLQALGLLLDHGAEVNAAGGEYGYAIVAAAAIRTPQQEPTSMVLNLLLDHGANIDAQEPMLYGSALHQAIGHNDVESVELLLDRGASTTLYSEEYGTPVEQAKTLSYGPVWQLLQKADFETNLQRRNNIREKIPVPKLITDCIEAVELYGMGNKEVYRGFHTDWNQILGDILKAEFNRAHVAQLLKDFIWQLPGLLIPRQTLARFVRAAHAVARQPISHFGGEKGEGQATTELQAAIRELPQVNRDAFESLVLHFERVANRASQNTMTSEKLAAALAPCFKGGVDSGAGPQLPLADLTWALECIIRRPDFWFRDAAEPPDLPNDVVAANSVLIARLQSGLNGRD